MNNNELFESTEGLKYFKEQLDFIPEENRDSLMDVYLLITTMALLC